MSRGRRAEPEAVKRAKGNPGKRPIAATTDEAPALKSASPKELSDDARKVWDSLSPELTRLKFLRESDRAAFARYCEYASRWWALTKVIATDGETYWTESAHGKMRRVNPDFLVRDRIETRLQALEDRFGLSPAARQQILQRLALAPQLAPPGDLFEDRAKAASGEAPPPARPSSPIGLLAKSVH